MRSLLVLPILLSAGLHASTTYLSQSGPNAGNFSVEPSQSLIIWWTQTITLTNVTISADIAVSGGLQTGTAYLTNAIGSGTTSAANQIAVNTGAFFPVGSTPSLAALFSGVTLGPGTYFLVITGPGPGESDNNFWEGSSSTTTIAVPGIAFGGTDIISGSSAVVAASESQPGYLPSSNKVAGSSNLGLQFAITDSATAPEPATILLGGAGLLAIAAFRAGTSNSARS